LAIFAAIRRVFVGSTDNSTGDFIIAAARSGDGHDFNQRVDFRMR